ncbi:MAG: hypothetical protein CMH30_09005 [Micavibrio sp.]|nr:hypothetical protein [Micavibrio sp.]
MSSEAVQKQKDKLGIMRYAGQDYAVGLLWLTSEDEEDPKAPRQRAKQVGADFYVIRNTVVNQNGIGYLEQGHKRGLPAAASTAADVMVGEWHGVFVAENGWWYVAVHADAIAPDGDILFDDEEEAYQFFLQKAAGYRWPRAFVPDNWEFEDNAGEVSLNKIFDEIPNATLQPANLDALFGGRRNKDIAVVLAAILVGILFLGTLTSQILPSLLPQPRQAKQLALGTANELTPPPRPEVGQQLNPLLRFGDVSLPTPSFVVFACLKGMEDIVLPLPMWTIESIKCDGRIVTVSWNSNGGDLDNIRPYISRFGPGVTHTYDGARLFTATKLLPSLDQYKEQNIPLDRDRAILLVNDRFGDLGQMNVQYRVPDEDKKTASSVRRRAQSAVTTLITNESETKKPPFLSVELKTSTPPTKAAEYFNIPGLSFEMIEYNLNRQDWTYKTNIILRMAGGVPQ